MNPASKYMKIRTSIIEGKGAYAKFNIPKGTRIARYTGRIITKAQAEKLGDHTYTFQLDEKHDIDGSVGYNMARYINHSCDPNCESENDKGEIWICAIRDVKKGEEISYDYGYSDENFEESPCYCGASNCVGFMVKEELRENLK